MNERKRMMILVGAVLLFGAIGYYSMFFASEPLFSSESGPCRKECRPFSVLTGYTEGYAWTGCYTSYGKAGCDTYCAGVINTEYALGTKGGSIVGDFAQKYYTPCEYVDCVCGPFEPGQHRTDPVETPEDKESVAEWEPPEPEEEGPPWVGEQP